VCPPGCASPCVLFDSACACAKHRPLSSGDSQYVGASKILRGVTLFMFWTACVFTSHAQTSSSGTVTGTVAAADGNAIPNAVVVLSAADGPEHKTLTSADGSFLVKELPSGGYTLKVSSVGFALYEQSSLVVAIGRTTHVDICHAVLKSVLPHFRCSLETVAQRQPVEHTRVASINPRTAEPEKRDRPNGL
jgi:Carboxypeptidase regulatory-like domain